MRTERDSLHRCVRACYFLIPLHAHGARHALESRRRLGAWQLPATQVAFDHVHEVHAVGRSVQRRIRRDERQSVQDRRTVPGRQGRQAEDVTRHDKTSQKIYLKLSREGQLRQHVRRPSSMKSVPQVRGPVFQPVCTCPLDKLQYCLG